MFAQLNNQFTQWCSTSTFFRCSSTRWHGVPCEHVKFVSSNYRTPCSVSCGSQPIGCVRRFLFIFASHTRHTNFLRIRVTVYTGRAPREGRLIENSRARTVCVCVVVLLIIWRLFLRGVKCRSTLLRIETRYTLARRPPRFRPLLSGSRGGQMTSFNRFTNGFADSHSIRNSNVLLGSNILCTE